MENPPETSKSDRRFPLSLTRMKQSLPSFCFLLIMWAIAIKKSHAAYLNMAEAMGPGNPLCSLSKSCLRIRAILHLALCGQMLSFYILSRNMIWILWPKMCQVADADSPSSEEVNKWGRKMAILISCAALAMISLAEQYEDTVPFLAGLFAFLRSLFLVVSFLLGVYWVSGTVGQDLINGKYDKKWKKNEKRFTF